MNTKPTTNKELSSILRSNKQMSKLSDSSLNAISKAIAESGIIIPREAQNINEGTTDNDAVNLSKLDIVILALTSNPNKWFLVYSGNKKRQDVGLYQLGRCFEMIRRKENGKIQHYARYTGEPMNEAGKRRMETLRKKMDKLGKIASKNGKVKIHDASPFSKMQQGEKVSLPKKTRKTSAQKKKSKSSLQHAAIYPLTHEERMFIEFISSMPRQEYVLSRNTNHPESWHTFRWKWQTRYGFDLSQISLRQEKQADGTFNVYGIYTPNAANMMNPGLASFVSWLSTKGQKKNTFNPVQTQV